MAGRAQLAKPLRLVAQDTAGCSVQNIAFHPDATHCDRGQTMFKLIATMRRGTSSDLAAAYARYPTIDAARVGTTVLLRDDRILRVMIVRNEIPPAFVEWVER